MTRKYRQMCSLGANIKTSFNSVSLSFTLPVCIPKGKDESISNRSPDQVSAVSSAKNKQSIHQERKESMKMYKNMST